MAWIRLDRGEIAGGLGDLGVLIPLSLALITLNHLNATAVLVLTGLVYLLAGFYFRLPVPVQPLKAAAVSALAIGAGPAVIQAAGLWMGVVLLLFAASPFCHALGRLIPRPMIRGIQLGVGLLLVERGMSLILDFPLFSKGVDPAVSLLGVTWTPAIGVALVVGMIVLGLRDNRRVPASLVVIGLGLLIGLLAAGPSGPGDLSRGPAPLRWSLPAGPDFLTALLYLVLPQLPLTLGNAVVATVDVARRYFGERANRVTPRALCCSLGLANLAAGLIGGMPLCHGSGGMTAHYRFGARTAGATGLLGAGLAGIGLVWGRSAEIVLGLIPYAVLGALLVYVGIEHAILIRDLLEDRSGLFAALTVGALAMVSGSLLAAFLIGLAVHPLVCHGRRLDRMDRMLESNRRSYP